MESQGILNPIQTPKSPIIRSATPIKKQYFLYLGVLVIVLLGVGTGWLLSGKSKGGVSAVPSGISTGQSEAGILDESTFSEDIKTAEGVLEEEGLNGEGTHHLERTGGSSQNIYLASTTIDLESFVGKKVMVWGETQSTKKAGWFMDVIKIKIIN
jgi:hypothetical protein